jgi:acetyltransferase-like isoleucine patch superfamily enzyme
MSNLYRLIAISNHPLARGLRRMYRWSMGFSIPAPRWLFRPFLTAYIGLRAVYYFLFRILVCEPFFKTYCTEHGRNVRTGVYIHWVQGKGKLIVGHDVLIDGKCSFCFAVRYTEFPTLRIGNNVGIGHNSTFTIGREIDIGNNVMIAMGVNIFDSPGHPIDPILRRNGSPALADDVKAIRIEDDVWIGRDAVIFPGVTVGEGSVVAAGAIVMSNVPPYVVVAGNPARLIARITRKEESI